MNKHDSVFKSAQERMELESFLIFSTKKLSQFVTSCLSMELKLAMNLRSWTSEVVFQRMSNTSGRLLVA